MTQPRAEILSQGDEVVTGQIADTNAAWLSEQLTELGFLVTRHTTVGDDLEELSRVLAEISERTELCVCTGGLGPTIDDLTAEAAARAFALSLREDHEALRQIAAWFAGRANPMPEVNRKQALLPEGASRIDNLRGTAPGFALNHAGCRFVFLPGVPGEMKFMFERTVQPELRSHFRTHPAQRVTLRVLGIGESTLQQRIELVALPPEVKLGFRTTPPENHVKLLFPSHYPAAERDVLIEEILHALGPEVFSIDTPDRQDGSLIEIVDRLMLRDNASLATLETTSCGHLAQLCGTMSWWAYGLVIPDNRRALAHSGLPPQDAFSDPLADAIAIAEHLRRQQGTTHALACVGSYPTGLNLIIAVATRAGTATIQHRLTGNLRYRHALAAAQTLDFLRRTLSNSAT